MKKYIIIIVIVAIVCAILIGIVSSCSQSENVTYIKATDETEHHLIYEENEYYAENIFTANLNSETPNQSDVKIGEYYSFPFFTEYYSYTDDGPDYIYSIGNGDNVYLKKDFDYNSEVFIIDETSESFVLSEGLTETDLKLSCRSYDIAFYLQKYPNLKIYGDLVFENENWYAVLKTNKAYLISPSLLEILKENGFI